MSEDDQMEVESPQIEKDPSIFAEEKKEEGNAFYKNKQYIDALNCYSQAIELCPTCAAYYGNRAATNMMLYKYLDALEDARQSVRIDSAFVKGYVREGKCHLALGDPVAAGRSYQQVLMLEPENSTALTDLAVADRVKKFEEIADADFQKGDYRKVLYCMERCIEQCPACVKFRIRKAEVLALLGRYQESQEYANDILRKDSMNADAIHVRGMCLYYQDNIDKAFQHFQQVLRLAPDHQKAREIYRKAKALIAKKEEGNKEFRSGNLQAAYNLYTEALAIDPNNKFTNSKLYFNRATVGAKLNKMEEAIADCTRAVDLDDTYLKAYLRRAKCYMDSEQYDEAVRDYEKIFKLDKSQENKRSLQEAKLELKKSKRKDYYKILGIGKTATVDEIKKAYRKRALVHHPDRHSHDTPEVQKEEEKKFKEVGEAYSVLSDERKKSRYDSGADIDELEGGGGFDFGVDPNQIFQTFFSSGGGPGFSFGGAPGGGVPGGFSFQFG
ncbi:dnaJ homolog subfamily C member 7-like isoform X1 [Pecten maximus]|uniref:dnaJ homolog subfamily C member 7-like isoform X1 n=2 Tax=Pecten maximus TaxID=6579 RepID=UPI001458F7CF|nr:dnaJ homolog subfamily C member 7-like isoform X1 [Pecten maximus]